MTAPPLEQSVNGAGPRRSAGSRRHRRGFWVVAFAFLAVMALGTVPSRWPASPWSTWLRRLMWLLTAANERTSRNLQPRP